LAYFALNSFETVNIYLKEKKMAIKKLTSAQMKKIKGGVSVKPIQGAVAIKTLGPV
jgi:hypothetical protein